MTKKELESLYGNRIKSKSDAKKKCLMFKVI